MKKKVALEGLRRSVPRPAQQKPVLFSFCNILMLVKERYTGNKVAAMDQGHSDRSQWSAKALFQLKGTIFEEPDRVNQVGGRRGFLVLPDMESG